MAEVIPFRVVLYNPEVIDDMARVVAPPYDVISERMQENLYRRHKYNIVRLILGKGSSSDNKFNNKYTRACDYLNNWLKNGISKKDDKRAFYIYEQTYTHKGKQKTRLGFIGLMKIEDPHTSKVLPHEYTSIGPKKDRLKLLNEVRANLSPIFSLFDDENSYVTNILVKTINNSRPSIDINIDGVNHKLWRLDNTSLIKKIQNLMKSKPIFIADGHHRYEVALSFLKEMKRKKEFRPVFNYIMVYFSNLNQEAITILSTHRVIKKSCVALKKSLLSKLNNFFKIEKIKDKKTLFHRLEEPNSIQLGLYGGRNNFYLLTLKDENILDELICAGKSSCWNRLPVTVLHELILNRILRIKEKVPMGENIVYTKEEEEAIRLVDKGGCKIAFFLNPTRIDQLKDVAKFRERMPYKSTYFYPKLLSGLVINKF